VTTSPATASGTTRWRTTKSWGRSASASSDGCRSGSASGTGSLDRDRQALGQGAGDRKPEGGHLLDHGLEEARREADHRRYGPCAQGAVVRPVEQQRGDPDHLAGSEARDLDLLPPDARGHQHAELAVEHQEEPLRRLARASQGLAGLEPHQGRSGHRLAELVVAQASKQRAAAHRSRHSFDGRPLHGH
jgi:hypothetical protein